MFLCLTYKKILLNFFHDSLIPGSFQNSKGLTKYLFNIKINFYLFSFLFIIFSSFFWFLLSGPFVFLLYIYCSIYSFLKSVIFLFSYLFHIFFLCVPLEFHLLNKYISIVVWCISIVFACYSSCLPFIFLVDSLCISSGHPLCFSCCPLVSLLPLWALCWHEELCFSLVTYFKQHKVHWKEKLFHKRHSKINIFSSPL